MSAPLTVKLTIGVISRGFDCMLDRTINSLGSIPNQVEVIVQVADDEETDNRSFTSHHDSEIERHVIRILPVGDTGIYNAMNRVRLAARGDYLWFINAGDSLFMDSKLPRFLSYLNEPGSYGFRSAQVHGEDAFIRPAARYKSPHPRQIAHPGAVYHRSAYRHVAFDESRSISSDLDFTDQSFHLSGWQYVPEIVSVFQLDGVSSRYWFKDFQAYSNEPGSVRLKFLIKMILRSLLGPKWLHRILLFRKCDRIGSQSIFPQQ
jgi:glycosyltransferase involved in cell wall biosynthesis